MNLKKERKKIKSFLVEVTLLVQHIQEYGIHIPQKIAGKAFCKKKKQTQKTKNNHNNILERS